jgi:hypothetical protein
MSSNSDFTCPMDGCNIYYRQCAAKMAAFSVNAAFQTV